MSFSFYFTADRNLSLFILIHRYSPTRKPSYHPDIVVLKEEKESIINASASLAQCMRSELADTIYNFAEAFDIDRALSRGKSIESDSGKVSKLLHHNFTL